MGGRLTYEKFFLTGRCFNRKNIINNVLYFWVNSFNSIWENETAYIGVGGSIPFANDFVREFPKAELVLVGAADEELGNAHAPNESVQIDHIEMLIESLVKTLKNIS